MVGIPIILSRIESFMNIAEGQEGRNARLAFYFLLAGALTFLFYIPVFTIMKHFYLTVGVYLGFVSCLVGLWYARKQRIRVAAIIAISLSFITINWNAFFVGGVFSIGDLFLIPTNIIAWLIFGYRVGIRLSLLCLGSTLGHLLLFLFLGSVSELPLENYGIGHALLETSFKLSLQVIIFSLIFLFSYFMNRALSEVEALNASISAMLHTDAKTAIAIFDADQKLIAGSTSQYFKVLFSGSDLKTVMNVCEIEHNSLVLAVCEVVLHCDPITWQLNEGSLPSSCKIQGQRHQMEWQPIFHRGSLDRIVLMIHHVEDLLHAQTEANEKTEQAMLLLQLVSLGSSKVLDFMERARVQIEDSKRYSTVADSQHAAIALHTLKGTSRMLGFMVLAEYIHQLESSRKEDQSLLFNRIDGELRKIENASEALGYRQGSLVIPKTEAIKALAQGNALDFLQELVHPSLENIILAHQHDVEKLARSLGRSSPVLTIDSPHGVHHMSQRSRNAMNQCLTHIFRNALDHSIEPLDVRRVLNKADRSEIVFRIRMLNAHLEIVVSDDGQGLNLQKIENKAKNLGLFKAGHTPGDIANLIFEPGFSTVDSVSDISGRGVGMDAIRSAMQDLGGDAHARLLDFRNESVNWELVMSVPLLEVIDPPMQVA